MKKLARLPGSDKEMKTHYVSAALSCFLMRLSQDIAREQFFHYFRSYFICSFLHLMAKLNNHNAMVCWLVYVK
jgi:hypothetical protein